MYHSYSNGILSMVKPTYENSAFSSILLHFCHASSDYDTQVSNFLSELKQFKENNNEIERESNYINMLARMLHGFLM